MSLDLCAFPLWFKVIPSQSPVWKCKWEKVKHFPIRSVHRDIITVFYSPTNVQVIVLKSIL